MCDALTHMCDLSICMTYPYVWHVCMTCHTYEYARNTWHDVFICVTHLLICGTCPSVWLLHMCDMCAWHATRMNTRVICDMIYSYVWRTDSYLWVIHMYMTSPYVWHVWMTCHTYELARNMWHDIFICVTHWLICVSHPYVYDLIYICDMYAWRVTHMNTHVNTWHDLFICVTHLLICVTYPYVYDLIYLCDMYEFQTYEYACYTWHDLFICVTH